MDTLAFWLPLIFLFISALLGTAFKRCSRDHCLKKFDGSKVILPDTLGDWQSGIIRVFAQGVELIYSFPLKENFGEVQSLVIHPNEVDKIPLIIRPAPGPDTRAGVLWEKELRSIREPSFPNQIYRITINFYNMLRDAFGQAAKTIMGAVSKDSSVGKVKGADKQMHEIGSGLTNLVPNAWEPILEKYRGQHIVIERKTADGLIREAGVLEDYSSKYLLVRQVSIVDEKLLQFLKDKQKHKGRDLYDLLYSRSSTIIRNTLKS
jgi:hypothetical protein